MFISCATIYLILLYCLGAPIIWVLLSLPILNLALSALLRMGWAFAYTVEHLYNSVFIGALGNKYLYL